MKRITTLIIIISLIIFAGSLFAQSEADSFKQIILNYKQQNYAACVQNSKKFIGAYRSSSKMESVLLLMGLSYKELNEKDNAIKVLKIFLQKYPNSKYASKAQTELDTLQRPVEEDDLSFLLGEESYDSPAARSTKTRYSFSKLSWTKFASGACLIAFPVFLVMGNNAQKEADKIYNEEYMLAETAPLTTAKYGEVEALDKTAANYKNLSLASLVLGTGFLIAEIVSVGRIQVSPRKGAYSMSYNINF